MMLKKYGLLRLSIFLMSLMVLVLMKSKARSQ